MEDLSVEVTGEVTFFKDGVIIPVCWKDFTTIRRQFGYEETGPVACPTLHLESADKKVCICVVPKQSQED
jgi:hypothetical protein